jgi:hypothetical protein
MPDRTKHSTPWTEAMIPLTLPQEDRRTALRSFWLVLSVLLGATFWTVGWLLAVPFAWGIGLIVGLAGASIVFLKEELVRRLYNAWNRRLIRPIATLVSSVVTGICFFIIFAAVGRAGSRLQIDGRTTTNWESRKTLPGDAYGFLFAVRNGTAAESGWMNNYLRWAVRSGNMWSISLLPFLSVLRLLNSEQKSAATNIYTLF